MSSLSAKTKHNARQPSAAVTGLHAGAPIPFVRTNALAPFISFLNAIGTPVERLLGQARIPSALLDDSEALLPILSGYRFIELAARQEQMEDIGVVVGQRASVFERGAFGAALQGASTVYEYLRIGVRLIGEHNTGIRFWLKPEGEALRLNQHLKGPPGLGRCIADLHTLVITISTLRRMIGPSWSPAEIRLLVGDEALLGNSDVLGDAQLITGQRHTSFTISRALMELPVTTGYTGATLGKGTCLGESQPMPADFKVSIEQLILSLLSDGYPHIETAADLAGMSSRTLQRRLTAAGVTYASLVAASRFRLAREWLTKSDMQIAEIASALGYTAASNFARAFRQQTGLSPVSYRRNPLQG